MFGKKRAVLVDYMGDQPLSRLSSDRRTLYSFAGYGNGRAHVPVRIEGGHPPWICQLCNKIYEVKKKPSRCEQIILKRIRIVRADGRVEDVIRSSNVQKTMSLPEPCGSVEFVSAGDVDIADFELISKKNPHWVVKEL